MPSTVKARNAFLQALPLDVKNIYEFGSGWGGVAFALAKQCPTATIHAFEISWLPWFISWFRKQNFGYYNLKIYRKNFFLAQLDQADVVVCYLYPGAMRRLKPFLEKSLKEDAWVLSNSFTIPLWKPKGVISVNDFWKSEIYVYQMCYSVRLGTTAAIASPAKNKAIT